MKKYKKFSINRHTTAVVLFIAVFSFAVMIYSKYQENQLNAIATISELMGNADVNNLNKKTFFQTLGDISLIIFSCTGVSFLAGMLIEKNSKNDLYNDILTEDLLTNETFVNSIDKEKQIILLSTLEKINYFDQNDVFPKMLTSIRNKIHDFDNDYYFTYQAIDVNCSIKSDCIEKNIIRTFKLRSYENTCCISDYMIGKCDSTKFTDGKKNYELLSLKINGETIKICEENVKFVAEKIDDLYQRNCNFTINSKYILKMPLELRNNADTVIEIRYITRVPKEDKSYSVRVSKACKKFVFEFNIVNQEPYNIYSQAYGFYDNATETNAGARENRIKYEFNDWIFPKDGVIVNFSERS